MTTKLFITINEILPIKEPILTMNNSKQSIIKILINMSHKVALYFNNKSIDFRKFNEHFRMSLVKELDFK